MQEEQREQPTITTTKHLRRVPTPTIRRRADLQAHRVSKSAKSLKKMSSIMTNLRDNNTKLVAQVVAAHIQQPVLQNITTSTTINSRINNNLEAL